MAALSGITAVRPTQSTIYAPAPVYGATIAAGQPVYQDTTDSLWKLASCASTSAVAAAKGIAMTPGVSGGYGIVATGGSIILVGTTAAVGMDYHVGATAGTIVPTADLASTNYNTHLGVAATATQLDLYIKATGIAKA
ncbi:MAG: hypothetical protein ACOVQH_04980 [Burkholderiaceae bacterium]